MPVAYLTGNEEITPAPMNAVWAAFDAKLNALLGGRSPIAAWNAVDNGFFPARLLGRRFFFLDGITTYANNVPGFVAQSVSVTDPVTGLTVSGTGGRSYDRAAFVALAASVTPVTFDTDKRIVHVADIPQSGYPAGVTKLNAVGVFENSLAVHTLNATAPGDTEARDYYIQENRATDGTGGAALPTKKHNYACADIIIEGPTRVNLPYDDFGMVRIHNLQMRECRVGIGNSKVLLVLKAFECRTFRRNLETRQLEASPLRYFCEYQDADPRVFWFLPSAPSYDPQGPVRNWEAVTKAASMGANNLTNPAIIHEWIRYFSLTNNFAYFKKDIHELCDIYTQTPQWAQYFGDPSNPATKLGDLIHHKGTVTIKRISKTLKDPINPTWPLVTTDSVEFRGYETIVEDFAAKLLTVTRAADGNLQIVNADPDNEVDLIGFTTNLLKDASENPTRSWRLPTGISLDTTSALNRSPRKIESAIFESVPGTAINLCPSPDRLRRATVTTITGGSVSWVDVNNATQTRALPDRQGSIDFETSLPAARTVAGIDQITVADILDLNFFGRGFLPTQDFGVQNYANQRLRLTPFGLVLTFDEYVDVRPEMANATSFTDSFGNAYTFDNAIGKFHLKRAISFPGHGFGRPELEACAWIPPFDGRCVSNEWIDEVSGRDGADFSLPNESIQETGVKVLTFWEIHRLGVSGPGGYFWKMGQAANTFAATVTNLDGLLATYFNHNSPAWYANPSNRNAVISGNTDVNAQIGGAGGRRILAMPLSVDHFNGFAQVVNQLKEGKAIDYRCLRIPWGAKVLNFNAPTEVQASNSVGLFLSGTAFTPGGNGFDGSGNFIRVGPEPADNFACIVGGAGTLGEYWQHWLSAQGISIRNENDLPNWNDFRNAPNYRNNLKADVGLSVTNVQKTAVGWTRLRGAGESVALTPFANTPCSWDVTADVSVSIAVSMDADEAFSPGIASGVSLASYAGIRWVGITDVKAGFETLGFPCNILEHYIPLRLDRMELEPTLDPSSPVVANFPGALLVPGFFLSTSVTSDPSAGVDARLASLVVQPAATKSTEAVGKFNRSIIGWRPAADGEGVTECWKTPLSGGFTAWDFQNRSLGKFSNEFQAFAPGPFSGQLLNAVIVHPAWVCYQSSPSPQTFRISVNPTDLIGSMWQPFYSILPPWYPAEKTWTGITIQRTQSAGQSGSPGGKFNTYGGGFRDETGQGFSSNSFVQSGMRRTALAYFGRVKTPADQAARKSQHRFCAMLNSERQCFATRQENSDVGIAPASTFINVPVAAAYDYSTFSSGPVPYTPPPRYPRKLDWWEDNAPDGFFMQQRGTAGPPPDLADVPQDSGARHAIKPGFELHDQFRCSRILFDPGSALIALP